MTIYRMNIHTRWRIIQLRVRRKTLDNVQYNMLRVLYGLIILFIIGGYIGGTILSGVVWYKIATDPLLQTMDAVFFASLISFVMILFYCIGIKELNKKYKFFVVVDDKEIGSND